MNIPIERLIVQDTDITDTEGRQFESQSPIFVDNKLVGRGGFKTDIQAFKEFSERRESVISLISFLRSGFSQEPLTLEELFVCSSALYHLPAYMILRASQPCLTDSLPPSVIDTGRTAAGVFLVSAAMMSTSSQEQQRFSPEEIYEFANGKNPDQKNFFVEADNDMQSCPAPEQMVKDVLHSMLYYPELNAINVSSSDWREVLTEKDIPFSLLFGLSYYWFRHSYEKYGVLPVDAFKEKAELMQDIKRFYIKVNIALGFYPITDS